jgi:hypothetical protein
MMLPDELYPHLDDNLDPDPPRLWRRVLFIVITLLLVFAILATTILPGLLAAERNDILRDLPTPTVIPRT